MSEAATAATRVERPPREGSSKTAIDAASVSATLTPEEVAHHEELRRVRFFTIFLALMALIGAAIIAMLGGDPFARHLISPG